MEPAHRISNLTRAPGEISFDAQIAGGSQRVWFQTDGDVTPMAEAALAAVLMPAMVGGGTLTIDEPLSPRLLRTQREFQAIQRAWSLEWEFTEPLQDVEVLAPASSGARLSPTGRAAAFFSGGVDSWSTVLDNPDLTDLIFVRGIDMIGARLAPGGLADEVESRLREAADDLSLPLHVVTTNLRELSDPLIAWAACYGCAVVAVALSLGARFDRVLIAGDSDFEVQEKFGANWLVDQLWSTENLEIVDAGGRFSRMQRIERIAGHPIVQRTLRVCWENRDGAYNCGSCRKCLMTMCALETLGVREEIETFPAGFDLGALAEVELALPVLLTLWEDVLDAARHSGKPPLERALEDVVTRGKRGLGFPPSYRRRRRPPRAVVAAEARAAARGEGATPPSRQLFTTPEVAEAIAAAESVAILIGSYDGSGNYGDIAQFEAAVELLTPLADAMPVLPVLERIYLDSYGATLEGSARRGDRFLFFGDPHAAPDGLVPVPLLARLRSATLYLYGGGYLNANWGDRKLAMLRAAEQLVPGSASVCRLATGLQVDEDWLRRLPAGDGAALGSFELLGARDPASAVALAEIGAPGTAIDTADDAVGVLRTLPGVGRPHEPDDDRLRVNVHYADHAWMTDAPNRMIEFQPQLLAELGRATGRSVLAQPVIAYLDQRVDENPGVDAFAAACAERGIAVGTPLVLRPQRADEAAPQLRRGSLTLSCSYHVALTSLLLGIPTAVIRDNPYYEQKAAGLATAFGLPEALLRRSADNPAMAAKAIAGVALGADAAALRTELLKGTRRMEQRRAAGERTALARIAASAIRADVSLEEQTSGTKAQEELATVLASRSWRITEPLRRGGRRLRPLVWRARAARARLAARRQR